MKLTIDHFRDEEELMRVAKFPELEAHAVHHKRLLEMVGKLADDYTSTPNAQVGDRLAAFLKSWLSGHILGVDQEYSPYMNTAGLH